MAGFKVGSFTKKTSTGTQSVAHGLGTTPKLVILWSVVQTTAGSFGAEWGFSFGASNGSTSRAISTASDDAGTATPRRRAADAWITIVKFNATLMGEADFSSWDATNFTLNWTTADANAYIINFMAFSGVTASVLEWNRPTSAGNASITGAGMTPDLVMHF